jgi:hypothetical protein
MVRNFRQFAQSGCAEAAIIFNRKYNRQNRDASGVTAPGSYPCIEHGSSQQIVATYRYTLKILSRIITGIRCDSAADWKGSPNVESAMSHGFPDGFFT